MKKWLDVSREEGKEEERAEALAVMHNTLLTTLNRRFPQLAESARTAIEQIESYQALSLLTVEVSLAQDEAAARRAIKAYLP